MNKVIVIGLDGCSWELLNPWIAVGKLPTLKKIKEEGTWGQLESCLPPVTSPNWKCYSTGKNPGQLGVFWWENIDFRNHRIIVSQSKLFDGSPFWDYLGKEGYKIGIVNMPTNHPPEPVEGFSIAGGPDALDYNFTYPPELEKELKERYNYRVHSRLIDFIEDEHRKEEVVEEIIQLINSRFTVAKDLIARHNPDFIHLTIYYINVLQHHFWDDKCVLMAWQVIDTALDELMAALPDWLFIFMTDHGTNQIQTKFNINNWLEQEGYLFLKKEVRRGLFAKLGFHRERMAKFATTLKIKDLLKKLLSPEIRASIPTADGAVGVTGQEKLIDWERTKVIATGQGPIYINPSLEWVEFNNLKDEILRKLETLTDKNGRKIAKKIYHKHEIYSGPYLDKAPDLIIDQNDGIHISGSVGFKNVFEEPKKWLAENHKIGMFAAYGPNISPSQLSGPVNIIDIAPTILHTYGVPLPNEMKGRVLHRIFTKDRPIKKRRFTSESEISPRKSKSKLDLNEEEQQRIKDRLSSLGYL